MNSDDLLLLVLADGNLPTGAFVASSGLESLDAHALFKAHTRDPLTDTASFVRDSVANYAHSALPHARDAHRVVLAYASRQCTDEDAIKKLLALDAFYESSTLNHVARRASRAQGVALLSLYSKGFTCPPQLAPFVEARDPREAIMVQFIDSLKAKIRLEETHGHLPICWGVLAGALGLSIERASYLHLFLHARSLLSAAVRMNIIGPYASQQVLLHAVRPIIDVEAARSARLSAGVLDESSEHDEMKDDDAFERNSRMPATTWPLGEIIAARHDQLHSRMFNS